MTQLNLDLSASSPHLNSRWGAVPYILCVATEHLKCGWSEQKQAVNGKYTIEFEELV